ncbi:MAG: pentapeptide repeat-containing protein [Candidatus Sericytochromatia bacterium]
MKNYLACPVLCVCAALLLSACQIGLAPAASQSTPAAAADFNQDLSKAAGGQRYQFSGQNLSGRVFSYANMPKAEFRYSNLTNVKFVNTNLSEADFTGATVTGTIFTGANLSRAILEVGPGANGEVRNFSGYDFTGSILSYVSFGSAKLRNAKLNNANLSATNFRNADLTGADCTGATKAGAIWTDAVLTDSIGCGP